MTRYSTNSCSIHIFLTKTKKIFKKNCVIRHINWKKAWIKTMCAMLITTENNLWIKREIKYEHRRKLFDYQFGCDRNWTQISLGKRRNVLTCGSKGNVKWYTIGYGREELVLINSWVKKKQNSAE